MIPPCDLSRSRLTQTWLPTSSSRLFLFFVFLFIFPGIKVLSSPYPYCRKQLKRKSTIQCSADISFKTSLGYSTRCNLIVCFAEIKSHRWLRLEPNKSLPMPAYYIKLHRDRREGKCSGVGVGKKKTSLKLIPTVGIDFCIGEHRHGSIIIRNNRAPSFL